MNNLIYICKKKRVNKYAWINFFQKYLFSILKNKRISSRCFDPPALKKIVFQTHDAGRKSYRHDFS